MSTPENRGSLSEKFADFGAMPSEGMWDGIASQLEEKSSRKIGFWWWFSGLAAVGLISSWLVFNNHTHPSEEENLAIQPTATTIEKIAEAKENLGSSAFTNNRIFTSSESHHQLNSTEEKGTDVAIDLEIHHSKKETQLNPTHELTVHQKMDQQVTQEKLSIVDLLAVKGPEKLDQSCIFPRCVDGSRMKLFKPFEIGFRVGYYYDLPISPPSENVLSSLSSDQGSPEIEGSNLLSESYNVSNATFPMVSRNINLDFAIGKYVSERWMVHSGIWFSRANYQSDYNSNAYTYSNTNISSLAVPLGASYDFIKRKRFDWRGQLNFVNEFAVYENAKIDYINQAPAVTSKFTKGYSAAFDFTLNHLIKVGSNMHLNIAPSYRRYIKQNVQADAFLLKRNHWVGGTIGLVWRL